MIDTTFILFKTIKNKNKTKTVFSPTFLDTIFRPDNMKLRGAGLDEKCPPQTHI